MPTDAQRRFRATARKNPDERLRVRCRAQNDPYNEFAPLLGFVANSSRWWQIGVESISVGGTIVDSTVQGFYDSGAAFAPTSATYDGLVAYFKANGQDYDSLHMKVLNCTHFDFELPTIALTISDDFRVSLGPSDYFPEIPGSPGQCEFGIGPHVPGLDADVMIIGYQFFTKYVAVIDWRGTMQVGFALRSNYTGSDATQLNNTCVL